MAPDYLRGILADAGRSVPARPGVRELLGGAPGTGVRVVFPGRPRSRFVYLDRTMAVLAEAAAKPARPPMRDWWLAEEIDPAEAVRTPAVRPSNPGPPRVAEAGPPPTAARGVAAPPSPPRLSPSPAPVVPARDARPGDVDHRPGHPTAGAPDDPLTATPAPPDGTRPGEPPAGAPTVIDVPGITPTPPEMPGPVSMELRDAPGLLRPAEPRPTPDVPARIDVPPAPGEPAAATDPGRPSSPQRLDRPAPPGPPNTIATRPIRRDTLLPPFVSRPGETAAGAPASQPEPVLRPRATLPVRPGPDVVAARAETVVRRPAAPGPQAALPAEPRPVIAPRTVGRPPGRAGAAAFWDRRHVGRLRARNLR
jgi:hypothetical protein